MGYVRKVKISPLAVLLKFPYGKGEDTNRAEGGLEDRSKMEPKIWMTPNLIFL
jgi:hypothetical protein